MKKITILLILTILGCLPSYGQIGLSENFDNGIPADWTDTFLTSATQSCAGQSARDNIYSFSNIGNLTSPNIIGQSNETDLTVSFDYKIVDWSAATNATPAGWGNFDVEYSTDGGANWINIETIDDSNHIVSATCANMTYTVPAADLPAGSDFQLRFNITWAAGDYYMYYDNVSALQVAQDPPNCDAVLTTPADGTTDVQIANGVISWSGATGIPTSYTLTVGTTPGGNDVVDNEDVGNTTNYDLGQLDYETTYYVTIVPENDNGPANTGDCTEYSFTTEIDPSIIVDCTEGPVNNTFCYNSGVTEEFVYTSSDGSSLNLTVNEGQVENNFDEFIVLDSDGTELYNGYGTAGQIAGLTFQSSGDSITVQVTPDGSVSCQQNNYTPIDITVSCATCINPQATYTVVSDCLNEPQFFVDVDLTSIGDATDVDISDNQGNTQTVNAAGVYTFGPYPNTTLVDFTIENNQDVNCVITSNTLTQEFCTEYLVTCGEEVNTVFCYENSTPLTFTYTSDDGSPLNLEVNAGTVQNNNDEFIVMDTNGDEIYNGYGNGGDLSGLEFQSTGDEITVMIDPSAFTDCATGNFDPIDLTVTCSNCINPAATFTVVEDCINGPQFNIDVDLTSIGDATDVDITDNQGNTQTVNAIGVYTFGPYANTTPVEFTITNNQDPNCDIASNVLTQAICTTNYVDCSEGPVTSTFCYNSGQIEELVYISTDGSALTLTVNEGQVENNFDEFIVLDSNGDELYNGYGTGGDIGGLNFQSSGDQITVQVTPDGSVSCQQNNYTPIDITVACATCINPQATYTVVPDCLAGPQFLVDVDLTSIGDATDIDIEDNQGNTQTVSTAGVYTFGPYPNGTLVDFTVSNNQDVNCVISSDILTQEECTVNYVDCDEGPITTTFCYENGEVTEFEYISTDGTPLNLTVNEGQVENNFDEFIVLDTNGDELYNGYGDGGDISGLTFQSTGDQITIQVTPDTIIGCASSGYTPIDITVSCATCINPGATYEVVSNCDSGNNEFFVEVNLTSIGDATSLTVSDNQASDDQTATEAGTFTFGPYDNGTDVQITIENDDDVNCVISSQTLTQNACPPDNDLCSGAFPAVVNSEQFCVETSTVEMAASNASSVPVSCGGNVVQDVWYEFTASASNHMITLIDSPFNVSHAIYQGDCDGGLTEIYCSDEFDNFGGSDGIVATGLTINTTYYVRIFSDGPTTATFDLCITTPDYEEGNITCEDVSPFCAPFDNAGNPEPLIFANGYFYLEESVAEEGPDYGCLGSEPNPAWFFLQVDQTGDLEFQIVQNTAFNGDGNPIGDGLDVDFIVYGPFNDIESCGDLTAANTVDCSYSAAAIEDMNLPNAQAGDIYIVLITNFNQTPGYISLVQTNFGEDDGGTTDCTILEETIYGCEGEDVVLTSQFPDQVAYVWYDVDPDTGELIVIPQEIASGPTYAVSESGDYVLQSFNNQGVPNDEQFTVIYSESPIVDLGGNESLCDVTEVNLDATPSNASSFADPIMFTWYLDGDIIIGETDATLVATEEGVYTVEVEGTILNEDGNATDETCVGTDEITINNADFTVSLGDDQALCDEDAFTITAEVTDADITNAIYTWFDSDGNVIADETEASYEVTTSGTYMVEVSIDGCENTAEVQVLLQDSPVIELGDDASLCQVTDITLDATPDNTSEFGAPIMYTWFLDGNEITGETDATLVVTEPGDYSVEVVGTILDEDGNATTSTCTSTDMVTITNAEFTVDLGDDQALCGLNAFILEADVNGQDATNANYTWFDDGNNVIPGATESTLEVNVSGTYIVEVSIDGCEAIDQVNVIFKDSPIIDLGPDQDVCDGGTVALDATPANAADFDSFTYQWLDDQGDEVSISATPSLPGGTYTVTVIGSFTSNGEPYTCEGTDEITINDVTYTVNLGPDQFICDDTAQTLTATINGEDATNATYVWSDDNGVIAGETSSTLVVSSDGTYTVDVLINGICPQSDSVNLLFDLSPIFDLGGDVVTCSLDTFTLDATPSNIAAANVVYMWQFNGADIPEAGPTVDPTVYGYGTYTVMASSVNDPTGDCELTDSITFTEASADINVEATEGETSIELDYCEETEDVPTHEITFVATVDGVDESQVTYQWFLGDDPIPGETSSTYTAVYDEAGMYPDTYSVDVMFGNCTFVSAETTVDVEISPYESGCVISEGISPNRVDGMNDCLDLSFLSDRSGIESLKIYNRYGRLVFEKDSYIDTFCGQNMNGDQLTTATYFYVLEMRQEDPVFGKVKKGWIYVNQDNN